MQRTTLRPVKQALRALSPSVATSIAILARPPSFPTSLAGPSRLFSTSPQLSKKASKRSGTDPVKPSKGKAQAQDEEVGSEEESRIDGIVEKTKEKMEKSVTYARGVVFDGVERGRGKVSPSLLDNIRVQIPNEPSASTLNSIASVTVKQNTLFVEVWDTEAMKHVESALHKANLPGISPQKVDQSTLKIPVSRPTMEQRTQIMRNLHTTIESSKQQIRVARSDGIKAVGGKTASAADEVQELANDYGKQLDDLLAQAKKEFDK